MTRDETMRNETEAWGLNYERYALGELNKRLAGRLKIRTVCELPALGQKACPGLYSIGFGLARRKVTLVNAGSRIKKQWSQLGLDRYVSFVEQLDICHTDFEDSSFDYVWNDVYIPMHDDPESLIEEMKRISNRYVAIFSVNGGNVGFPWHSFLHKINRIPWTHGDKRYNNRHYVKKIMEKHGLIIREEGFVDTPIWPDSIGFRDMRLHKNNITFNNVEWKTPYIDMLENKSVPAWIKAVYAWERIPMFPIIKTLYSHLFYFVGEVL